MPLKLGQTRLVPMVHVHSKGVFTVHVHVYLKTKKNNQKISNKNSFFATEFLMKPVLATLYVHIIRGVTCIGDICRFSLIDC